MDMNLKHLQTALPLAILQANKKLQSEADQEPKPLVNLKRAVFDACKVGDSFDSTEMIESLEKFGYKRSSILTTLKELHDEGKLRRSQKMPYAYTKLRSWEDESDKLLKVKALKVKTINVDDLPRIPAITAFRDALDRMMGSAKPTTSFNMHDMDLVITQLTGMMVTAQRYNHGRNKYHPDDDQLADGYKMLAGDISLILTCMNQTKAHLGRISQMAAALRSMT